MYSSIGIVAIECGYIGKKGFNSFFFLKKGTKKSFKGVEPFGSLKRPNNQAPITSLWRIGGSFRFVSVFLFVCLLMC